MGRKSLEPGILGNITTQKITKADGKVIFSAHARYRDAGGVTRKISAQGRTRGVAKTELAKKHQKLMEQGTASGGAGLTVSQAVDRYMATLHLQDLDQKVYGKKRITQGTMRQYVRSGELAKELLGPVRLSDITVAYAQKVLVDRIDPVTLDGAAAMRHVRGLLMRAIGDALREGLADNNPLDAVQLPTRGQRIVDAPSVEELDMIRRAFKEYFEAPSTGGRKLDRRWWWITELLIATGMRIGELLAVRWCDVDFETRRIRIHSTVLENGKLERQGYAKTASSNGTVAVGQKAIRLLKEIYESTQFNEATAPVFATRTGNYSAPTAYRRALRTFEKIIGKETLSFKLEPHALRRFVATHLAETHGVEVAAKQLRHKSSTTTQAHYIKRAEDVPDFSDTLDF